MGLYSYTCKCGKTMEIRRGIKERNHLPTCICGRLMDRDITAHARLKNFGGDE